MKNPKWLVLVSVLGLAGFMSCSTLRTSTDFDPSANFGAYRTFDVERVSTRGNDLLGRRIQSALETALSGKGLREADRDADLLVSAHARLSSETQVVTWGGGGWGWGWRWHGGPGMAVSTVEQIPVGTLVVDLVDGKTHQLVWRSTARDVLDPGATPQKREQAIATAISKMFESYPRA
jgi:hypothetical protein